uniref:Bifunctional diacylglycerol diphosphate phosphatase/phosphatidate phosphatase n=1 Tax=Ganoderma boninense TaxID=34458 RepID=A0A5K1JTR5_9APHY|nr:Bifunctional diacylglycerol diphosphate phosphatase/phosphatidate phosphatase [Ganoderma boninense]
MSRGLFNGFRNNIDRRFGGGGLSLTFFDRAYLVDWVLSSLLWLTAFYIKALPPFERDFSSKDDLIDHKHRPNQISGSMNWLVAFILPMAVTVVLGLVRRSAIEVHHSLLALYSGRGLTAFITEALKNRVGGSLLHSKLTRLTVTLLPLGFATWVAVSRMEDYRHHKEDVIVGSLLGIACATICYLIYWPNPFTYAQVHTARMVYGDLDESDRTRMPIPQRYGYELTGMDHEHAEQSV